MKTLLVTIALYFSIAYTYAQSPVITFENLPHAYDTFFLAIDINPQINLGSHNPDQVWDFTGLNEDITQFAAYGNMQDLDFASAFPGTHIYTYGPSFMYGGMFGASPDSFGYLIFATDNDGFKIKGYRSDFGAGMVNTYNEQFEWLMPVPNQYLDESSSHSKFDVKFDVNPLDIDTIYRRNIFKTLTSVAYGELTTPYSYFPEALNVLEEIVYIDSVLILMNNIVIFDSLVLRDTLNYYNFWSVTHRHPVAVIEIDNNNNPIQARYLSNQILFTGIEKPSSRIEFQLYPNPQEIGKPVKINGIRDKEIEVHIYNTTGQLVEIQKLNQEAELNTNNLKRGIYNIVLIDSNVGKNTARLIIF